MPRMSYVSFHLHSFCSFFFFFNDTATTEIYTLSLHDALPICFTPGMAAKPIFPRRPVPDPRSEEHTSELQSPCNLVCRLLLEKKKNKLFCWVSTRRARCPRSARPCRRRG